MSRTAQTLCSTGPFPWDEVRGFAPLFQLVAEKAGVLTDRQRVYDLEDTVGTLHVVCRQYLVYPTDNHLADVGKCVDVLLEREPALRERVAELRRPLSRKMASSNPAASPAERRVR